MDVQPLSRSSWVSPTYTTPSVMNVVPPQVAAHQARQLQTMQHIQRLQQQLLMAQQSLQAPAPAVTSYALPFAQLPLPSNDLRMVPQLLQPFAPNPLFAQPMAMSVPASGQIHKVAESAKDSHRRHTCNVCSKAFTCSSNLQRHKRIHSGEKPYACMHCNMAFSNSSNRRKHEKLHCKKRPFSTAKLDAAKAHIVDDTASESSEKTTSRSSNDVPRSPGSDSTSN